MGLSITLALIREGSVAAVLAEKMSRGEKIVITALLLGTWSVVRNWDAKNERQPFDMPDALVERHGDVTVQVSVGSSRSEEAGRRIGRFVARELSGIQDYLRLEDIPPIFLVQWRDLEAGQYESDGLLGADGLVVRANFTSPAWDDRHFLAWLVREMLIVAGGDQLTLEPNMWVLDGFPLYWATHGLGGALVDVQQLELRAAYGWSCGFSPADVEDWYRYRERVGEDIAAAVAWYGLEQLARTQGEPRCRHLLRRMLRTDIPADVLALVHHWSYPLPTIFEREAGIAYDHFLERWQKGLAAITRSRQTELSSIPRLTGRLIYCPISELTCTVHYAFECDPAPDNRRILLRHGELPSWDTGFPQTEIKLEDLDYRSDRTGVLPGTFARGTRYYWTFSVCDERLGCQIINGWQREEMN